MKNITIIFLAGLFIPTHLASSQASAMPRYECLAAFFVVKYGIIHGLRQTDISSEGIVELEENELDNICQSLHIQNSRRAGKLKDLVNHIWYDWKKKSYLAYLFEKYAIELFECSLADNNDLFIKKAMKLRIRISKEQAPECFRLVLQYRNLPMLALLIKESECNPNIIFKNPYFKKNILKTHLLFFTLDKVLNLGSVLDVKNPEVTLQSLPRLEQFLKKSGYNTNVMFQDPYLRENVLETTPLRFALDMLIESMSMCDCNTEERLMCDQNILQYLITCREVDVNFSPEGTYTPLAEIASYCLHPAMQGPKKQYKLIMLANFFLENGADCDLCYGKSILIDPSWEWRQKQITKKPCNSLCSWYNLSEGIELKKQYILLEKNIEKRHKICHNIIDYTRTRYKAALRKNALSKLRMDNTALLTSSISLDTAKEQEQGVAAHDIAISTSSDVKEQEQEVSAHDITISTSSDDKQQEKINLSYEYLASYFAFIRYNQVLNKKTHYFRVKLKEEEIIYVCDQLPICIPSDTTKEKKLKSIADSAWNGMNDELRVNFVSNNMWGLVFASALDNNDLFMKKAMLLMKDRKISLSQEQTKKCLNIAHNIENLSMLKILIEAIVKPSDFHRQLNTLFHWNLKKFIQNTIPYEDPEGKKAKALFEILVFLIQNPWFDVHFEPHFFNAAPRTEYFCDDFARESEAALLQLTKSIINIRIHGINKLLSSLHCFKIDNYQKAIKILDLANLLLKKGACCDMEFKSPRGKTPYQSLEEKTLLLDQEEAKLKEKYLPVSSQEVTILANEFKEKHTLLNENIQIHHHGFIHHDSLKRKAGQAIKKSELVIANNFKLSFIYVILSFLFCSGHKPRNLQNQ